MAKPKIFISYRRGEDHPDEHVARNLHNSLAAEFGSEALFRDVDDTHLLISRRFRDVLTEQLAQCTDCIVVIGPKWIKDIPRLHDLNDFVRMEISDVIKRPGVGVIPVMVGGASIPRKSDLPKELKALVDYGGLSISNESAKSSIEKLIAALKFDKTDHIESSSATDEEVKGWIQQQTEEQRQGCVWLPFVIVLLPLVAIIFVAIGVFSR